MRDGPTILVCRRIATAGGSVPGSLPDRCSKCGARVWVAPSSWLILHDRRDVQIKCLQCVLADPDFVSGTFEDLSQAQVEEIKEYLEERRNVEELLLVVRVKGENIMRNPLLSADGVAFISGKRRDIAIETPITSIPDFIEAFEGLFREEKQERRE